MNMDKRGAEITLNTVIIGILVVIVLVVLVTFFLGGTSGISKTIRSVFYGTTSGTDKALAIEICKSRCEQAKALPESLRSGSAYCTDPFTIDENNDGEADFVNVGDVKKYLRFYCDSAIGNGVEYRELTQDCILGVTSQDYKGVSYLDYTSNKKMSRDLKQGDAITCKAS